MAVWLTVAESLENTPLAKNPSPAEVAAQIALLCRQRRAFSLVLRALKARCSGLRGHLEYIDTGAMAMDLYRGDIHMGYI